MGYVADAGSLVVSTVFAIAMLVLILRLLLQVIRANFYNPICQLIYKVTNPVLMPINRVLPAWRGLNVGAIVVAWLLSCLWILVLAAISGVTLAAAGILMLGFARFLQFLLQTLFWVTLISVLLSWFSPDPRNPAVPLLYSIADIVLRPVRRVIPPLGGLDLSPIIALLGLQVLMILLVAPVQQLGTALAR